MYSADQIIPPNSDLAHDLLQWSEDIDNRVWNIANVTNELIEELKNVCPKVDVYRAMAVRCKGVKVNTVRRWAECAADFSPELQEKYSVLSFNHFKTARSLLASGLVPDLEYPLAWCLQSLDDTVQAGRPRTVNELLANFLPEEEFHLSDALKHWKSVREKLLDFAVMWDNDTERKALQTALNILDTIWRTNE